MMGMGQKVKEINAATALEKAEMYGVDANDGRAWSSRVWAMVGKVLIEMVPAWLAVAAMLGLIFGGCCSNVRMRSSADVLREECCLGSCADISGRCLLWKLSSSEFSSPHLEGMALADRCIIQSGTKCRYACNLKNTWIRPDNLKRNSSDLCAIRLRGCNWLHIPIRQESSTSLYSTEQGADSKMDG